MPSSSSHIENEIEALLEVHTSAWSSFCPYLDLVCIPSHFYPLSFPPVSERTVPRFLSEPQSAYILNPGREPALFFAACPSPHLWFSCHLFIPPSLVCPPPFHHPPGRRDSGGTPSETLPSVSGQCGLGCSLTHCFRNGARMSGS